LDILVQKLCQISAGVLKEKVPTKLTVVGSEKPAAKDL
jgi:hypothetical protein